ncbi:methyltransferase domain-containing protein [Kineococcus sp. T13]|uniref:class I SAM-dependent methyltransferase n=1 Tax=Kineococcus vitellinus TaxID=2696565 RepID=UPI001413043C|nr:class I SAM-dependent methyltransferase [Kineococcus vitellinus]NAZ77259.1 methyltransferase domain-containing protein [Kineococcus vitellinus]
MPGVVPSPNVWNAPDVYELENLAVDRGGRIEDAVRAVHDWAGRDVLDVGCGTGFHLPRFALRARSVTGVEPHPPLLRRALQRVRALEPAVRDRVRVLHGAAAALPLPDASVDVVHARWAYFFGPGCEPGLAELERVVRRGGTAFVVDNDATTSTFGRWFARSLPGYDPLAVDRFFARRGWDAQRLLVAWEFETRADLEAVVRIEFTPQQAAAILAEHEGTSVDYAVVVRSRRF